MHRDASKSPARVLAPLALVLCSLAFLVVIISAGSGDGGAGDKSSPRTTAEPARTNTDTQPRRSTYTVKTGDTLGGIAAKTDVSVEKLQELNPGLDPQALVAGQKLKLRE